MTRWWPHLAVLLGLWLVLLACRSPKGAEPVEPEESKPRIVVVEVPCWSPPPELPTVTLPVVDEDAVEVVLPMATYRALLAITSLLTDHVLSESIRCGPRVDAGVP